MRVYEVFLKKDGKDPYVHAGSLEAPDDEMALLLARESYVRRGEGDHMWLVAREHLVQADETFLGPNASKPHRHNDGSRIAGHRRAARSAAGPRRGTGERSGDRGRRVTPELRATVLALADDEMLMGHHHAHWICVAPFLEEDLAFCSIGQDELGHAATLYELLVDEAEVDRFALRRPPGQYRSAWLCEADLPDWSDTVVRHWLYDTAEQVRWEALAGGDDGGLAALARAALREEAYHRRHATATLVRLLAGTDEARTTILASLQRLAPLAGGLFEDDAAGWTRFTDEATADLAGAGVAWTWADEPATGQGRAGVRSPDFAAVQARLNAVFDIDPDASW